MSQTVTVTPEGRAGVWIADRPSLKAWIEAQDFDAIHNFMAGGSLLLGADHEVDSVLADIDDATAVALLTGAACKGNLGHALALIMPPGRGLPERLAMYDIGDVEDVIVEEADHAVD